MVHVTERFNLGAGPTARLQPHKKGGSGNAENSTIVSLWSLLVVVQLNPLFGLKWKYSAQSGMQQKRVSVAL